MSEILPYLVPLPTILPLFAAGIQLSVGTRWPRARRGISVVTLVLVLAIAVVLLVGADTQGPLVVHIGGWEAPIGISLVADRMAALLLVVSMTISLTVLIYAIGQGMADEEEIAPVAIFHPSYLVLAAGVANAYLTGDLFNLYVSFELLLLASYVLLTLGGTQARVRAGATYVVVSLLSSLLFLTAIGLIYAAAGTVNLAHLALRLPEVLDNLRLVLQVILLTAFAIKAAVFPLSAWLPDSYPTAPAPATAVFAGLLTKVGVYALIRTQTLLFPEGRVDGVLLVAALVTMVVGVLGAVAQTDVKRLISFTLVSHIGYMVFGLGLGIVSGLSAALVYTVHHITVQTTLFMVAGLIERRGGSSSIDNLGGLAKLSPIMAVLYFIPAMNLGGIPPLSGFIGKLGLLQAGVDVGTPLSYALVAGAVATSLLTLYTLARVWNHVFWRAPRTGGVAPGTVLEQPEERAPTSAFGPVPAVGPSSRVELPSRDRRVVARSTTFGGATIETVGLLPKAMTGATMALVAVGVSYTVLAGPLIGYSERAAGDLVERTPYISAVFPEGVPEP